MRAKAAVPLATTQACRGTLRPTEECGTCMTRTPPDDRRRLTGGAPGAAGGDLKAGAKREARRLKRSALFRRVWSTTPVEGVLPSWAQSAHHQAPRGEWKFFVGKAASPPVSQAHGSPCKMRGSLHILQIKSKPSLSLSPPSHNESRGCGHEAGHRSQGRGCQVTALAASRRARSQSVTR